MTFKEWIFWLCMAAIGWSLSFSAIQPTLWMTTTIGLWVIFGIILISLFFSTFRINKK